MKNQLTRNFTLAEATHSDTAKARRLSNEPNEQEYANILFAAKRMETIRNEILGGNACLILSWFRSLIVNSAVGGSSTSDHMSGLSIDFICPKFGSVKQVCEAIEKSDLEFDQLIYEQSANGGWVHIGFGPRMRRQVLSKRSGNPKYFNGIIDI